MLPTLHGQPHLNNVLYIEGEHDLKGEFTSKNKQPNKPFYELDMKGSGANQTNVSLISPEAGDVDRAENDIRRLGEIKEKYPNISPQMLNALGAGRKKRSNKNSQKKKKNTSSTSSKKKKKGKPKTVRSKKNKSKKKSTTKKGTKKKSNTTKKAKTTSKKRK